jgi:hypothetical protein
VRIKIAAKIDLLHSQDRKKTQSNIPILLKSQNYVYNTDGNCQMNGCLLVWAVKDMGVHGLMEKRYPQRVFFTCLFEIRDKYVIVHKFFSQTS